MLSVLSSPLGDDARRPDFKIFTGSLTKGLDAKDGKKRIRCIASSSVKDLHGDTMTSHCVKSMAKQAVGLTIFLNHSYKIPEDVFGKVEKARTKTISAVEAKAQGLVDKSAPNDDVVLLELDILVDDSNPRAERAFANIENGIVLGISIGALITDYEEDPDYQGDWFPPLIINDVDLLEASVVGIPANPLSWVENATKGLIARGLVAGADENTFNRMRRSWQRANVEKEVIVEDEEQEEAPTEPTPDVENEAFVADGVESIIAHYQTQVEAGLLSSTDLDEMEDAVQHSIDFAIEHGVDSGEFVGRTAKEIASEILASSAAPDEPDAATEEASPDDDQEAPAESVPESDDAGVDGEAEKQAEAELEVLRSEGGLSGLTETVKVLGETLTALIAERKKSAALETEKEDLTKQLAALHLSVKAAVEVVNKFMDLPLGRKSVVRREAAGLAERLAGTPYSAELLSFIAKHTQGAPDAP